LKPEYQALITIVGFVITVYGFYSVLKAKSIEQATKINTLELKISFSEQIIKEHTRRLDDHDKQNQALVAMTEQMKNLTEDVRELKTMIKERK
jgi:phage membrane protein